MAHINTQFRFYTREIKYRWGDTPDDGEHTSLVGFMDKGSEEFHNRLSGDSKGPLPVIDDKVFCWYNTLQELFDAEVGDELDDSAIITSIQSTVDIEQEIC